MQTLLFSNQDKMPAIGLGTWNSPPGEVYNAVKTAIKTGYRHIDCAAIYGNEQEIGQALSESIAEGVVSRKELWITSKLWNNAHAKESVIPALKQSLSKLQLDYLDLYLIHWPITFKKVVIQPKKAEDLISLSKVPIAETWESLEEAVAMGLIKHIGVSNFGKENLQSLISASKIKPEMNQVESHPYLQQEELLSFCKAHGIHVTAYSPLGSSNRPERLKAPNEPKLLDDPVIKEVAESHACTAAQILISWALHREIAVIPKSVHAGRIAQNLQSRKIALTDTDMNKIAKLDKSHRYISGEFWVFEGGPFTLEDVWR